MPKRMPVEPTKVQRGWIEVVPHPADGIVVLRAMNQRGSRVPDDFALEPAMAEELGRTLIMAAREASLDERSAAS